MSRFAAIALGTALLGFTTGTAIAEVPADVQKAIRSALTKRFPEVPVRDIRESPLPGIYEVLGGDNIAYSTANGDYLFLGPLIDTRTGTNLTDESMGARTAIDFSKLPLEKAITIVKGNGSRRLAVFTDPDCPFCRQLEPELEKLADVTLYMFLYPLTNLHPDAGRKAEVIWCAADRTQAWREWMSEAQKLPPAKTCGATPVVELEKLGRGLGVDSTPTLFTGDGRRIAGVLQAEQIERLLAAGPPATAQNAEAPRR
jgi:thiol:disulfide interchange protein DsbC